MGLEQKPGTLAPHLVADTCYSSFSEESACDLEIMAAAPPSPAFPFSFWLEKPRLPRPPHPQAVEANTSQEAQGLSARHPIPEALPAPFPTPLSLLLPSRLLQFNIGPGLELRQRNESHNS